MILLYQFIHLSIPCPPHKDMAEQLYTVTSITQYLIVNLHMIFRDDSRMEPLLHNMIGYN